MKSGPLIIWRQPALPNGITAANILNRLRQRIEGRVDRAYVFGSFGTPEFHASSDIDLILVKQTTQPFWERASEFSDLYDVFPRIDLMVYREEELALLLAQPQGFWASVKATLRPLIP